MSLIQQLNESTNFGQYLVEEIERFFKEEIVINEAGDIEWEDQPQAKGKALGIRGKPYGAAAKRMQKSEVKVATGDAVRLIIDNNKIDTIVGKIEGNKAFLVDPKSRKGVKVVELSQLADGREHPRVTRGKVFQHFGKDPSGMNPEEKIRVWAVKKSESLIKNPSLI